MAETGDGEAVEGGRGEELVADVGEGGSGEGGLGAALADGGEEMDGEAAAGGGEKGGDGAVKGLDGRIGGRRCRSFLVAFAQGRGTTLSRCP